MKAEPLLSRNAACHKNKGDFVDHMQLQTKYNNIKQQWRLISNSKRMVPD